MNPPCVVCDYCNVEFKITKREIKQGWTFCPTCGNLVSTEEIAESYSKKEKDESKNSTTAFREDA